MVAKKKERRKITWVSLPRKVSLPGFTWGDEFCPDSRPVCRQYKDRILENADKSIQFIFHNNGDGTTRFTTTKGTRTFDRHGVNSSFYWTDEWDNKDGTKMVAELTTHLARIEARRVFIATSITVPQIGYSISEQMRAEHQATLKSGRSITFTPSGFGQSQTLYTGRQQFRYDTPATQELKDFFAITGSAWIQKNDHD